MSGVMNMTLFLMRCVVTCTCDGQMPTGQTKLRSCASEDTASKHPMPTSSCCGKTRRGAVVIPTEHALTYTYFAAIYVLCC